MKYRIFDIIDNEVVYGLYVDRKGNIKPTCYYTNKKEYDDFIKHYNPNRYRVDLFVIKDSEGGNVYQNDIVYVEGYINKPPIFDIYVCDQFIVRLEHKRFLKKMEKIIKVSR